MDIKGTEGLGHDQLQQAVWAGGKFVVYQYIVSVVFMSFKRSSPIFFIPPGRGRVAPGLKYTLLTAAVGWLGFPWGFIWTPIAIVKNLGGGTDVTTEVAAALGLALPAAPQPYPPPSAYPTQPYPPQPYPAQPYPPQAALPAYPAPPAYPPQPPVQPTPPGYPPQNLWPPQQPH